MRAVEELRPLTAGALLAVWREHRERVADPLERVLLCNAAVLKESCFFQGKAVYESEAEVLRDLMPREMEELLELLAEGRAPEERNPAFDTGRFDAMRGR